MINSDDACDRRADPSALCQRATARYTRIVNKAASSFLKADDNLSAGSTRCGPTVEPTGFQEREPLDVLAGVINCTSFN